MNNYRAIWESINMESRSKSEKTHIARKIPSSGVYAVFLATDFARFKRLLYVCLGNRHLPLIEKLPSFRGLEISICKINLGEYINSNFLRLEQTIPHTENIFESVIADVCERIIQIENESGLENVLLQVLNEWRVFFEKEEAEILSLTRQKGLFSELLFLRDVMFPKFGFSLALSYWTGADRTNHDFQIGTNGIEIKSTSSKEHRKFVVASEKQLDSTGLDHLYLVLYGLNIHANMPGGTLPALIDEIEMLIQDEQIAVFLFTVKLAKSGYHPNHRDDYTVGFSVGIIKTYEVAESFPRLLSNNLPNGIGDLKYSVVAAACEPFLLQTDILNLL